MLAKDIAELMKLIQREEAVAAQKVKEEGPTVKGIKAHTQGNAFSPNDESFALLFLGFLDMPHVTAKCISFTGMSCLRGMNTIS